jgi:hypothetical protein
MYLDGTLHTRSFSTKWEKIMLFLSLFYKRILSTYLGPIIHQNGLEILGVSTL